MSQFTALEQVELTALRVQALGLTDTLAELDKAIEAAGAKLPGHEGISSIKGIGARSAAILLSGIGNIEDFESAGKLVAYVGIVPRVSQSNDTHNRGRITKRGNKLMRTTLVQCTLVAIRYSGYLNAFYQRIKERRGAGKAIIATARKLLSIIYDTLKNGWIFEDFPTFIPLSLQNPKILVGYDAEIVCDLVPENSPFFGDCLSEKRHHRSGKLPRRWIMAVVGDVLVHHRPKPLDRVQMRTIRRQRDQVDPAVGTGEESTHLRPFVIGGVVPDDVNHPFVRVAGLDLG